jgi:hypothetical protein
MRLSTRLARGASEKLKHLELREALQRPRHGIVRVLPGLCPQGFAVQHAGNGRIPLPRDIRGFQLCQAELEAPAHAQTT